jgi:hypothetical protein
MSYRRPNRVRDTPRDAPEIAATSREIHPGFVTSDRLTVDSAEKSALNSMLAMC